MAQLVIDLKKSPFGEVADYAAILADRFGAKFQLRFDPPEKYMIIVGDDNSIEDMFNALSNQFPDITQESQKAISEMQRLAGLLK